jgi:hypothetical protein
MICSFSCSAFVIVGPKTNVGLPRNLHHGGSRWSNDSGYHRKGNQIVGQPDSYIVQHHLRHFLRYMLNDFLALATSQESTTRHADGVDEYADSDDLNDRLGHQGLKIFPMPSRVKQVVGVGVEVALLPSFRLAPPSCMPMKLFENAKSCLRYCARAKQPCVHG